MASLWVGATALARSALGLRTLYWPSSRRSMKYLSAEERQELQRAADRSKTFVDVEELGGPQRELVAAFARKLDGLPDDFLEQIKKKVFKSSAGETP
jgi:hypothetical protein